MSKIELKEVNCYTHLTEIEIVVTINDKDYYALGQYDENGHRTTTIKTLETYDTVYDYTYGFEHTNTGELDHDQIFEIEKLIEKEL